MIRRPQILLLAVLVLVASRHAAAQDAATGASPPAAARPARPDIYDTQADAHQQIATALLKAQKENRRVLIQWGANSCGWCHLLHELCASDKEIAHELLYEYDVVLVDIGEGDKNMDLAASYGADLGANGVPYLTILDSSGKVLANHETGTLETGSRDKPGHDPAKVLAFLKEHQAPYLKADDALKAAMTQAKSDGRRIFVHFGAPSCPWCHKLDEWLAREPAASLMPQDFVDCRIDVDRMLGGKEMLAEARGSEEGGIPWIIILPAGAGDGIASSDGPNGNIGFPAAPEEIAHFRSMLEKAAVNLDAGAIDTLVASLQPAPAPAR